MKAEAIIVVVDDDRLQCETVALQLRGEGDVKKFDNPYTALDFVRSTPADVAIVDMRMPAYEMDGKRFLEELRKFDTNIAVIIRTADESEQVADAAIEARATKRFIKSRTTAKEVKAAVRAAIDETRRRRSESSAATDAATFKNTLVSTLGSIDDEVTVAEMCRGVIHSMLNSLSAVSGYSELIVSGAEGTRNDEFLAICMKNRAIVSRMTEQLTEFLDSPFIQGHADGNVSHASTNQTVEALRERFKGAQILSDRHLSFEARDLAEDVNLSADAKRILSALRHLIEFIATHAVPGSRVRLTTGLSVKPATHLAAASAGQIVFNRANAKDGVPSVIFMIQADLPLGVMEIKEQFHKSSADPRQGNLFIFSSNISSEKCAVSLYPTKNGVVFDIIVASS